MLTSRHVLRTTAAVLALVAAARGTARGNPASEVTTGSSRGLVHDLRFEADYEYDSDSATIAREHAGDDTAAPLAPLPRRRELEYHQSRQLLTPRIELGMYRDLWISLAAPIVLAQSSELDVASGIDRAQVTTFSDGILPSTGFDASAPNTPPGGNVAFRGVNRNGLLELRPGIGYAPMSQARDDTQPTWKIGAELRLAIGRVMRFDAVNPSSQPGVSSGVDELRLWTSFDRRTRYFEGWFEAFYQTPVYIRGNSLYGNPGFGAVNTDPSQTAGASFGVEAFLYDDFASGKRVTLDVGTEVTAHLEGRGYSEMWEVFAYAGDHHLGGPLVLDADPVTPGLQPLSHPGVSNIESYLETAAKLAVRAHLAPRLDLALVGRLAWKTDHLISFADPGVDLPTCPTGAPRCETDDNGQVNPGTIEVNPLHARTIDLVGHRYRAEDGRSYAIGLEARYGF